MITRQPTRETEMAATTVEEPITAERVADAVESAEMAGGFGFDDAARALWRTVRHTRGLGRRAGKLGLESAKVVAGRSSIEPAKGDWRFKDATWLSNPAYRRLMQLYLAWSDTLTTAVAEADIDWRDSERARFLMDILTSALAPTNFLAGNPSAIKHAFETGGLSLVRGTRNLAQDVVRNGGMPRTVDASGFEVGRNLAATPGAVVYRDEVCEVIQYTPSTPEVRARPVLMVPPQINKYYFMDLAPGRSFIEYQVSQGLLFFVISWRNPGPEQRDWDFDVYAAAVEQVIDVVRDISRSDDVNLLSLCAGGILTTTVLNHLAVANDLRVRSASFGVTLLDFSVRAPIGMFRTAPVLALARSKSVRAGVLDGSSLGAVFTWMRPNDLVWNYWVNNYLMGKDPPRFDILAWNADSTDLPATLHRQFLDIFEQNVLARPGEFEVLGTPVDLGRLTLDTYVTGATTDHLTPWKACYRSTQLFNGSSTFVLSNAGHIASLINPPGNPKAHYFAGPEPGGDPDDWLSRAERRQGTWWDHWAAWIKDGDRSGSERPAPTKLGSRRYRTLEDAPGTYVHG
jgi:polyhydroxyalkanoate synthase subunit PhaC